MFAVLHSDINSPKCGFLHLVGQPYCKKSGSAKVKDGIISLFLKNYLVGQYSQHNDTQHKNQVSYEWLL
jgi:hypothetical protein